MGLMGQGAGITLYWRTQLTHSMLRSGCSVADGSLGLFVAAPRCQPVTLGSSPKLDSKRLGSVCIQLGALFSPDILRGLKLACGLISAVSCLAM